MNSTWISWVHSNFPSFSFVLSVINHYSMLPRWIHIIAFRFPFILCHLHFSLFSFSILRWIIYPPFVRTPLSARSAQKRIGKSDWKMLSHSPFIIHAEYVWICKYFRISFFCTEMCALLHSWVEMIRWTQGEEPLVSFNRWESNFFCRSFE